MPAVVTLQISNVDLDDDATLDALAEIDNVAFGTNGPLTHMTVFIDDENRAVRETLDKAAELADTVGGAQAIQVEPDLVSQADIASRIGLSRETIRKWVNKESNKFPLPHSILDSGQQIWRWIDIAEWLHMYKCYTVEDELASSAQIDQINVALNPREVTPIAPRQSFPRRQVIIATQRDTNPYIEYSLGRFSSTPPQSDRRLRNAG